MSLSTRGGAVRSHNPKGRRFKSSPPLPSESQSALGPGPGPRASGAPPPPPGPPPPRRRDPVPPQPDGLSQRRAAGVDPLLRHPCPAGSRAVPRRGGRRCVAASTWCLGPRPRPCGAAACRQPSSGCPWRPSGGGRGVGLQPAVRASVAWVRGTGSLAIGVKATGERKVLGMWARVRTELSGCSFCVGWWPGGYSGVRLVISDAHEGLKEAMSTTARKSRVAFATGG